MSAAEVGPEVSLGMADPHLPHLLLRSAGEDLRAHAHAHAQP